MTSEHSSGERLVLAYRAEWERFDDGRRCRSWWPCQVIARDVAQSGNDGMINVLTKTTHMRPSEMEVM
jgi:hypothetical protein